MNYNVHKNRKMRRGYLLILAVFIFICNMELYNLGKKDIYSDRVSLTPADYCINILGGMEEYHPNQNNRFEIPMRFLTYYLIICLMSGYIVKPDMQGMGKSAIINTQNRYVLLFSKYIESLLMCIEGFICLLLEAFTFSLVTGAELKFASVDSFAGVTGCKNPAVEINMLKPVLIAMVTIWIICLIQITVELLFSSVAALIVSVAFMIFSLYYNNALLIFNFCILKRSYPVKTIMVLDIFVFILCVVICKMHMRKKDIL